MALLNPDSKPHYVMLDGLRGIAALMVLLFHLFEAVAFAAGDAEQNMFHGFLAVDFFFILSGFVMGYAYDQRWQSMSVMGFFRRRLVRLHPMVIFGVVVGLVAFLYQGSTDWNGNTVPFSQVLTCFVLSLFLLPSSQSIDVRGNTELFPLNGPHWSLFFEYIGSILYAIVLRRLKTSCLAVWVFVSGVVLLSVGLLGPDGSIGYGWSSDPFNFFGGLCRVMFSYPAGLLMARLFVRRERKQYGGWLFLLMGVCLCGLLSVPSMSGLPITHANAIFEVVTVTCAFPLIVWISAHGTFRKTWSGKLCDALGSLSYPLYAVHYPFIYMYIYWINENAHPFGEFMWSTPVAVALICLMLGIAACRMYDIPVRRCLNRRFVSGRR